MSATPLQILPRHDISVLDIGRLEDRLYDHNRGVTGANDGQGLAFAVMDAAGVEIGAIAGYSWAGMAEIKQLWLDEAHRGLGVGRRLLQAAIAEATARGCSIVWVMSHDFQAPGFYERCGFRRVAELQDWPPGYRHIILQRRLQDDKVPSSA